LRFGFFSFFGFFGIGEAKPLRTAVRIGSAKAKQFGFAKSNQSKAKHIGFAKPLCGWLLWPAKQRGEQKYC
jgi:hypothetical protein